MKNKNSTDDVFNACHFNEFIKLDIIKRYGIMSSISTFALATACCYIDNRNHLEDIINFMMPDQQYMFKKRVNVIRHYQPNPALVIDVQQMIMHVCEHVGITPYTLSTVAEIVGIEFSDPLGELSDANMQVNYIEVKSKDSAPLFSLEKLTAEIKHRKIKDIPKLKELVNIGAYKPLYYASKNKVSAINALVEAFPNFVDVIGQVKAVCQISLLTNAPLSLPVINLQGPPGIGKTQFIKALAKALQLEFFTINAAAMSGRFELCGGNPQYGDADIGAIGRIMCYEAKSFQPLILIDELCMAKDNHYDSIIQPLYSFFDREQRKSFRECFLNLELDLSGAIIFTTTNNYKQLKPALKSRLVNIDIKSPSSKQMKSIMQNIYKNCLIDMKLQHYFNANISAALLSMLSHLAPRIVIETLRLAIGNACVRADKIKKVELVVDDFDAFNVNHGTENEINTSSILH